MAKTIGAIRTQIWTQMLKQRVLAYPIPANGHHPNFKGAAKAAKLLVNELFEIGKIKSGDTVLSYPDYVLRPLRKLLLERGVVVIVPAKYKGYRKLDGGVVNAWIGSSISGAEKEGELINDIPDIVMAFIAVVAIDKLGSSLSKGYGFNLPADLKDIYKATIVHPVQVLAQLPKSELNLTIYANPQKVNNLSP
ncbi:MAG TPA: hypothetical protein ENK21_10290 [Trueperaceae bacterium]|nr:hypothetical protein [Trueperaceae bacterium]